MSAPFVGAEEAPVKVFILAGQSNMVGHGKVEMGRDPGVKEGKAPEVKGGIGSLRWLVKTDPEKYGYLVDEQGDWIVRDDVWFWSTVGEGGEKGPLAVGSGKGGWIGPEFAFGHVVGKAFDEPVLLIKTAWGGKDLAIDFRPPSAGKPPYDLGGRQKAIDEDPEVLGHYYRLMLEHVKHVLGNLGAEFPELAGRKTELVGFGWHQGWNDGGSDDYVGEYEENLVHLIKDLREELGTPDLPVVIANSGFGGEQLAGRRLELAMAQMAVADPEKHPEFKGTVRTVDTRPFNRTMEQSPSGFGYHWNHNGETHYLIGEAMGKAILELLKK